MSKKPTYKELEQRVKELEKVADERKLVDDALHKSEEKFKNIVESSPMGIHIYNLEPDGRLVFIDANPAADDILGLALDQMQGRSSMDPRWRAIYEDGSDFLTPIKSMGSYEY